MAYNVVIPVRSIASVEIDAKSITIKTANKNYDIDCKQLENDFLEKFLNHLKDINKLVVIVGYTSASDGKPKVEFH